MWLNGRMTTTTAGPPPDIINDQRYELVEIDRLEPHPDNPNVGDRESIGESIDENGFYGATLVRELEGGRLQILGGEHRWLELKARGSREIPVIIQENCDDVRAIKILLGDNETNRRGRTRTDVVDRLLRTLPSIAGTGYQLDKLQQLEEGRVPAPGEDAIGETGNGSGGEKEFAREYGIVLTLGDERSQIDCYEWLQENSGLEPHQIRIVSI